MELSATAMSTFSFKTGEKGGRDGTVDSNVEATTGEEGRGVVVVFFLPRLAAEAAFFLDEELDFRVFGAIAIDLEIMIVKKGKSK